MITINRAIQFSARTGLGYYHLALPCCNHQAQGCSHGKLFQQAISQIPFSAVFKALALLSQEPTDLAKPCFWQLSPVVLLLLFISSRAIWSQKVTMATHVLASKAWAEWLRIILRLPCKENYSKHYQFIMSSHWRTHLDINVACVCSKPVNYSEVWVIWSLYIIWLLHLILRITYRRMFQLGRRSTMWPGDGHIHTRQTRSICISKIHTCIHT